MVPRRPSFTGLSRILFAALVALASGCHVPGARIWNLREVHKPNGRPRREARTQSDVAYSLQQLVSSLQLGANPALESKPKTIRDPLGKCFENVVALSKSSLKEDMTVGLQAEGFAWLAVDCTYALSRERAARALGPLAARLGVKAALPAPEAPSSPEDIASAYETLVVACSPIVRGEGGSSLDVRAACEAIGELQPDRAGTLRLLRAANVLLEHGGKRTSLDALRGLQRSLAKRAVSLALGEVLDDPDGRVLAAGITVRLGLEGEDGEALLRWVLGDPHEGVENLEELALAAVGWVGAHGLPAQATPEDGAPPEDEGARRERWTEVFLQLLGTVEGRLVPACSRALAMLTGRPASLRPEEWFHWWRFEREEGEGPVGSEEGRS